MKAQNCKFYVQSDEEKEWAGADALDCLYCRKLQNEECPYEKCDLTPPKNNKKGERK